ncbi:NUDIX domain-containing protein [Streptomyces sp. NBC_00513]|uniref:NUDIX domain-containing protein n=1 Tax=unclassified Streptomyces TaxID=2593676 RepID=UPI0022503DCC|nr:NUDIX domain-containing protein [Streptomyces sp. NBC_00424]MCX5074190.1 NUDIX domain-containing protein [Streptomyces sp. NBC_00424]WUD42608.1 NUDIX domain-containing protein [Streptomyces sp. NBC_00513]
MSTSSPQGKSEAPHSVSVAGAVLREDGRLLAIRRADSGTWELPGGVLELSESPEVYAVRLPDALDGAGPHVRSHDGRRPTGTSV